MEQFHNFQKIIRFNYLDLKCFLDDFRGSRYNRWEPAGYGLPDNQPGIKDRLGNSRKSEEKIRVDPENIMGSTAVTDTGSPLSDGAKQSGPTNQTPIYGTDLLLPPVCSLKIISLLAPRLRRGQDAYLV